jgi:hypothetical protein
MEIMDDFMNDLNSENISSSVQSEIPPAKEAVEHTNKIIMEDCNLKKEVRQDLKKEGKTIPALIGTDYPDEYKKMVERIQFQYYVLPTLDYEAIYNEMSILSVKSAPTPTLQVLSDELHRVQSAKDRLSEMLIDIIKCYNFKKRAVDILKDAWGKFSSEKNTESRKGDATFRISEFLTDFAETEALAKSCDHVFKNLDSLHDNLSRRITVWQLIIKLRDVGRGALPDFDFDKVSLGGDIFSGNDKNKDEDGNVVERNF